MNQRRLIRSFILILSLVAVLFLMLNLSGHGQQPRQESLSDRDQAQPFDFESLSQRFLSHF